MCCDGGQDAVKIGTVIIAHPHPRPVCTVVQAPRHPRRIIGAAGDGTCKLRQRRSLQQQVPCSCRVRRLFIARREKPAAAGEEVVGMASCSGVNP